MSNNSILFALYTENLLDKSVTSVCLILSKKLNMSVNAINKKLNKLQQEGKLQIKNNKIIITDKHNTEHKYNSESNLVLGVIKTDGKGYYYFKPTANQLPEIPLVASQEIKDSVNKRCCCDITKQSNNFTANLKQVFGEIDDPISENTAIAYKYSFKKHFSQQVIDETASIPQEVLPSDFSGREDLRDIYFMTWDPATCKDKDDAIYAEKTKDGYTVYIAIADVNNYVKKGTELDKEAFRRGTSCYLGSGVYPMLPPELSNGICSLNENVDRLALVSKIDIDKKGNITNYNFIKAVINVKQAFSYENAEKVWLSQDGFEKTYAQAKAQTDLLYEITYVLENKLKNRGNLEFLSYEPSFVFNIEKNKVEDVETAGTERSHKVVEEFMILANEATAQFFKDNNLQGIYRIHGKPYPDKISLANSNLKKFKLEHELVANNKSYQKMLTKIKDMPSKEYLNSVIMQTMSKAKYSAENVGHFGLASQGYTHFTSPIRRYSDLVAHRIISEVLENKHTPQTKQYMNYVTEHLNNQEIKASKAEKESDKYLCCLWAENHLNEVFNGYITRVEPAQIIVRHKGITVQIPTYLLKNGNKSNFVLSNDGQSLKDKNSNNVYNIGDYINFKIAEINKEDYTIFATDDLQLEDIEEEGFTL